MTIAFWDIQGFTNLTDRFRGRPHFITDLLKEFYDAADAVVRGHDGILDKFIGDGVMAIFGYMRGSEEDFGASDAALAALDLRRRFEGVIRKHQKIWRDKMSSHLDASLRCGIDFGEGLLVGLTGTDLRDQFTAFGPEVNRANRIEGRSSDSPTGILASASVRKLIEGRKSPASEIRFGKERRYSDLKGFERQEIVTYELLSTEEAGDYVIQPS